MSCAHALVLHAIGLSGHHDQQQAARLKGLVCPGCEGFRNDQLIMTWCFCWNTRSSQSSVFRGLLSYCWGVLLCVAQRLDHVGLSAFGELNECAANTLIQPVHRLISVCCCAVPYCTRPVGCCCYRCMLLAGISLKHAQARGIAWVYCSVLQCPSKERHAKQHNNA